MHSASIGPLETPQSRDRVESALWGGSWCTLPKLTALTGGCVTRESVAEVKTTLEQTGSGDLLEPPMIVDNSHPVKIQHTARSQPLGVLPASLM